MKVHRRETVAVKVEEIWYRSLTVKKVEGQNIKFLNKSTQKNTTQSYLDIHHVPIM